MILEKKNSRRRGRSSDGSYLAQDGQAHLALRVEKGMERNIWEGAPEKVRRKLCGRFNVETGPTQSWHGSRSSRSLPGTFFCPLRFFLSSPSIPPTSHGASTKMLHIHMFLFKVLTYTRFKVCLSLYRAIHKLPNILTPSNVFGTPRRPNKKAFLRHELHMSCCRTHIGYQGRLS